MTIHRLLLSFQRSALLLLTLAFTGNILAQAPQGFNYQAVVRDAQGNPLAGQTVGIRIALLQGSPAGTNVYQETFTRTSNANGLVDLVIGTGATGGNFAGINWANGPYYVQVGMDLSGGTAYTVLGTSQLWSVPYALHAGSATGGGNTLQQAYDQGGPGAGRVINASSGAVELTSNTASSIALRSTVNNGGNALNANSTSTTNAFSTVQAVTNSNNTATAAVIGNTDGGAYGLSGQAGPTSTTESAIYGSNLRTTGGHGVLGIGVNGVVGNTNYSQGNAMYAENFDAIAPLGNGVGSAGKGYYGVVGEDRYLGTVGGAFGVLANGNLGSTGTKSFIIDHPLDPANKVLKHFSMESNEVLNLYRGNAVCDQQGEAVVELPEWFEAINRDPSYHLTPIGAPASLYIKEELANGRFVIGGGAPGMKVSWTVQAERNDAYLQQYPAQRATEEQKRPGQQGRYFMPVLHGADPSQAIFPAMQEGPVEQRPMNLQD